ncbi:MAG: hypothetical protein PHO70_01090 [Candidatus Omnitrophica bacterium]|nr:hypothetical protein [Candidatus Omnitrophota bacterium]
MKIKGKVNMRRAQSTLEYLVFIAIIVAAVTSMAVYMKRAILGKYRTNAEQVSGRSFYSPGATESYYKTTKDVIENNHSDKFIQEEGVVPPPVDVLGLSLGGEPVVTPNVTNITVNSAETVLPFAKEPVRP